MDCVEMADRKYGGCAGSPETQKVEKQPCMAGREN